MRQIIGTSPSEYVEVEGLVLPASWDEVGKPWAFKISSPGELNYLIVDDVKGRKLKHLLRQYVRLFGRLEIGQDGEMKIAVDKVLQHE